MPTPQPIDLSPRKLTEPTKIADFAIATGSLPAVRSTPATALQPISLNEAASYGADKIAGASTAADKITAIARCGDMDEVGQSFNALLVTAKKYDPSSLKKGGGFLGLFKAKIQELKNQFATVDQQVDRLVAETDGRVALFKGRIGDLEHLYDDNEARYHQLGAMADEFEVRIAWMEQNLPAVDPNDAFSVQHLADWKGAIDLAKKTVDDMRRGQALCQMTAPMIRQMQSNSGALVMKFGEIKSSTIPVLKQAFALYILNLEQEKGAAFATAVDDLTNETLKKNAEKLGQTTVAVQTSLARSSIDMATLQSVQASTIKAIEDAQRIRSEMQTRLQTEAPQIAALSQQLAQRLAA
jgi:uncharacterized protein YaaN involved in tellurite resistance